MTRGKLLDEIVDLSMAKAFRYQGKDASKRFKIRYRSVMLKNKTQSKFNILALSSLGVLPTDDMDEDSAVLFVIREGDVFILDSFIGNEYVTRKIMRNFYSGEEVFVKSNQFKSIAVFSDGSDLDSKLEKLLHFKTFLTPWACISKPPYILKERDVDAKEDYVVLDSWRSAWSYMNKMLYESKEA